jgi:hypothetical protein
LRFPYVLVLLVAPSGPDARRTAHHYWLIAKSAFQIRFSNPNINHQPSAINLDWTPHISSAL